MNTGIQNTWYLDVNVQSFSPLQLEAEKILTDNDSKIRWFFRFINDGFLSQAQNNVYKEISWMFPTDNLEKFYDSLTSLIEVEENIPKWSPVISDTFSYSKQYIKISYWYNNEEYLEDLEVHVRRDKEDPRQHHIEWIWCWDDVVLWPFCRMINLMEF